VEVLNFGVNGYNTRQEVETLREKGLQFEPDLVVVAYCVNDKIPDSGGIRWDLEIRRDQQARLKIPRLLFKSALFRQIWAVVTVYSYEPMSNDGPPMDESDRIVPEALASLKEMSVRHGFDVMVVAFPYLTNLADGYDPDLFDDLRDLTGHHNFHMFDLSASLSKAAKKHDIMIDDLHPTPYGHQRVGEVLADYVQANLMDTGGKKTTRRQVTSLP
jgi:lysophospholipase L1-like esterase